MRIAIFAHYDRDDVIDEYVIAYLKELRLFCDKIVFVSDCNLPESETYKISSLCSTIIAQKHGEYDFGSYKRGFQAIQNAIQNEDVDQLIICNDSCYLIGDLKPVFEIKKDFFGLVTHVDKLKPHLQSYFVVFNKAAAQSQALKDFMFSITKLPEKEEIIKKYEVGMTQKLANAGFSYDSLVQGKTNPMLSEDYFRILKPDKFPLIKTDFLKNNIFGVGKLCRWKEGVDPKTIQVIENHISRMIGNGRSHWYIPMWASFFLDKPKTIFGKILSFFLSFRFKRDVLRVKIFGLLVIKMKISGENDNPKE